MPTFNVTVVDQYNWLAGIVNSIVNVKPKIFSDYFLHSSGPSLIAGHLIPKELYFYDYSGAPRYGGHRGSRDPECLGNHGFELMFLSGLGIPMLGIGDFSEAVRENIEILERTGDDIEIYTRNYSITATTGYNATSTGEYSSHGPNNTLRDNFPVDASATGYFDYYGFDGVPIGRIEDLFLANFACAETDASENLVYTASGAFVVPQTTMDPYFVKVASFSGASKAKDIIMPFDYNKNRSSPKFIIGGGGNSLIQNENVGFGHLEGGGWRLTQGPNSGKKFDSISMPFINYSADTNEADLPFRSYDTLTNDDPFDLSTTVGGMFGPAQRIWNHKFLEAANLAVEGGISCGGIRGQEQILRNRHLITNRNLYTIFRYWSSGFKWVSINDVKAKALELDIPFELRRVYTPYKFKTSTFSINEEASLMLINSGAPYYEGIEYPATLTGFGGWPYRAYGTALHNAFLLGGPPFVRRNDSAHGAPFMISSSGRFGEHAPDSTIYFPNFNTGGKEANFFELIGTPTGTFTFNASGYSPWVYEAPNFVFDDLGEGDWCVPKSRETDIIKSNIFIHHTDSSSFTNFKLYKNDLVKTQSVTGSGCILQTKSTALDNTPRDLWASSQQGMSSYFATDMFERFKSLAANAINARSYVMNSEPVSLSLGSPTGVGYTGCRSDSFFSERYRWINLLTKFTAQPVFEIDTDQEWKEIAAYSAGASWPNLLAKPFAGINGSPAYAGLGFIFSPKYCFIEDLSTFGSIEKVFKKHIATVKYTPPSPTEGIEISTIESVTRGIEYSRRGDSYLTSLCPPYNRLQYFTEDTGILKLDFCNSLDDLGIPRNSEGEYAEGTGMLIPLTYDTRTVREDFDLPVTSTIPQIDLNLFYKEITTPITGEAGRISIIDINGGTLIEGDEDGGIYQINLFVNDTISAE